jgi:GH24 family phage-related lysozyme (muramidase)
MRDFSGMVIAGDLVEATWGYMRGRFLILALAVAGTIPVAAQSLPSSPSSTQTPAPAQAPLTSTAPVQVSPEPLATVAPAPQPATSSDIQRLLAFKPSDIKFDIDDMMDLLRDKRHEGWVLTAYPDPRTGQPLIGAGFSLDLPARLHPQTDPLNPNQFLEPSSAELWQAAGLAPEKLQRILSQFQGRMDAWSKHEFRAQMLDLDPQITPEDANALLRMGVIQAAINAKAYCRYFDKLTASQQMAMSQLVYQMGVNLQEFTTFLNLINRQTTDGTGNVIPAASTDSYWHEVQKSLIESQWARLYRDRAIAVIAMFDPHYTMSSLHAERRISVVLRPARRRRHGRATLREAGYHRRHSTAVRRRAARRRRRD